MVPRIFTPEQKENRMNICVDNLQKTENDPDFLGNGITCDESWFFQYDSENKCQSMLWKSSKIIKKKSTEAQIKFQSNDDHFFLYLRDCSH
jgi:hypothetical protein